MLTIQDDVDRPLENHDKRIERSGVFTEPFAPCRNANSVTVPVDRSTRVLLAIDPGCTDTRSANLPCVAWSSLVPMDQLIGRWYDSMRHLIEGDTGERENGHEGMQGV